MYVVCLKFGPNKSKAGEHMQGHKAWLEQGFKDGIFLLSGNLQPSAGGAIIAHGLTYEALTDRLQQDPFVAEKVVESEIIEISPSKADDQLAFLCD